MFLAQKIGLEKPRTLARSEATFWCAYLDVRHGARTGRRGGGPVDNAKFDLDVALRVIANFDDSAVGEANRGMR